MEIEVNGEKHKVKYRHERLGDTSIESYGGKTIASIELDGNIKTATAECSRKDAFNKKIGRMIATGRLKKLVSA